MAYWHTVKYPEESGIYRQSGTGKKKKRLCDNEKRHFTDEDEWIICANAHEPIISRDIFYKVRALYEKKINESSFSSG